jgi:hypothetical protein
MSSPTAAPLLGFLGKLICDVDTLMDTQPFRVWVRFSFGEARGVGLTRAAGSGSLLFDTAGCPASRLIGPKISSRRNS